MDETTLAASRREGPDALSERLRLAIDRLTHVDREVVEEPSSKPLVDQPTGESNRIAQNAQEA